MNKVEALERMRENLKHIGIHNSLFLLKNCYLLTKLLYTLRTVPTWQDREALEKFDETQRKILEETLKIKPQGRGLEPGYFTGKKWRSGHSEGNRYSNRCLFFLAALSYCCCQWHPSPHQRS